jgi:hypothetical protein
MQISTYFDIGATGAPFDVLVIPNQGRRGLCSN